MDGSSTIDGRRKHVYGTSYKEAAKKLEKVKGARDDGLPVPAERQKVASFRCEYLESAKPNLRPESFRRYADLVHFAPHS